MISDSDREHLQIGFKQSIKAVEDAKASKVLLALDCDEKISAPIRKAAAANRIEVVEVPTMKELGAVCGIEVGASCAVILKF